MSLDAIIEARMRIERSMAWRIKRYGYACLTQQEYTALCVEQAELHAYRAARTGNPDKDCFVQVDVTGLQSRIAARMGISQSWVSRLLKKADSVMGYFAMMDIDAGWQRVGGMWRLNAPIAPIKHHEQAAA